MGNVCNIDDNVTFDVCFQNWSVDSTLVTAHGKSMSITSFTKDNSIPQDIAVKMKERILQGYGLKVY